MDVCRDSERKSADIKTAGLFIEWTDLLFYLFIIEPHCGGYG